jgi:hypothetical protein
LIAVVSGVAAWKAAMKQIVAMKSERDRRAKYAASIAITYLVGVKGLLTKIEGDVKRLSLITEDIWRNDPQQILSILLSAQSIFEEPTARPAAEDVEQYREELPLFLFGDLRLVFRLEKDLGAMIVELLAQQRVLCSFPLSDCQRRFHDAFNKLKRAMDRAELSLDYFRYA